MAEPIGELTDRMRDIFGRVIEAYLDHGTPVGSKILAGSVNLSPASIRGVMQDLEERGLLTHPHTSAGRIPTERGLRLFGRAVPGHRPRPRSVPGACGLHQEERPAGRVKVVVGPAADIVPPVANPADDRPALGQHHLVRGVRQRQLDRQERSPPAARRPRRAAARRPRCSPAGWSGCSRWPALRAVFRQSC